MIRDNKKYLSWKSWMRNLMLPYADGFFGSNNNPIWWLCYLTNEAYITDVDVKSV